MPVAVPEPYLAADLIGFSAGLVITMLLLVLTIRAARLPGTPYANILLVLCAFTWNVGGLAHTVALGAGFEKYSPIGLITTAVQFTGAALWPLPLLSIWHSFAVRRAHRLASLTLHAAACVAAVVILGAFWLTVLTGSSPLPIESAKRVAAMSGSALALGAVLLLLRGSLASRAVWVSALISLTGVFSATASVLVHSVVELSPHANGVTRVIGQQATLLIVLGGFFLFARFRFADIFMRYSLRIVIAAILGGALALGLGPTLALTPTPVVGLFVNGVLAASVLLAFVALDRWLGAIIDPWITRDRDYRQATRHLGEMLRQLDQPQDIADAARAAVRMTLDLADARVVAVERLPAHLWPADVADGDIAELGSGAPLREMLDLPDLELLVPIRTRGQVSAVLAISPGQERRGLVTHEVNYLRSVAAQIGSRLDALRHEREMVERRHQESLLRQQLTEAELRALRAQIDPHFLFNSLNTIADLIVTNPPGAEAMTLRLAKVFRHVLAQASRPMTSIREEIDFLQAYLEIEEERFGDRLRVDIDIASDVGLQQIPSLILQPLVENALKHGLAPKPGPGHLWISARAGAGGAGADAGAGAGAGDGAGAIEADCVWMMIEDDGMGVTGLSSSRGPRASGVGLTNVSQRLAMMYGDRAEVTLEARDTGGTRVTIRLPRDVRALAV